MPTINRTFRTLLREIDSVQTGHRSVHSKEDADEAGKALKSLRTAVHQLEEAKTRHVEAVERAVEAAMHGTHAE